MTNESSIDNEENSTQQKTEFDSHVERLERIEDYLNTHYSNTAGREGLDLIDNSLRELKEELNELIELLKKRYIAKTSLIGDDKEGVYKEKQINLHKKINQINSLNLELYEKDKSLIKRDLNELDENIKSIISLYLKNNVDGFVVRWINSISHFFSKKSKKNQESSLVGVPSQSQLECIQKYQARLSYQLNGIRANLLDYSRKRKELDKVVFAANRYIEEDESSAIKVLDWMSDNKNQVKAIAFSGQACFSLLLQAWIFVVVLNTNSEFYILWFVCVALPIIYVSFVKSYEKIFLMVFLSFTYLSFLIFIGYTFSRVLQPIDLTSYISIAITNPGFYLVLVFLLSGYKYIFSEFKRQINDCKDPLLGVKSIGLKLVGLACLWLPAVLISCAFIGAWYYDKLPRYIFENNKKLYEVVLSTSSFVYAKRHEDGEEEYAGEIFGRRSSEKVSFSYIVGKLLPISLSRQDSVLVFPKRAITCLSKQPFACDRQESLESKKVVARQNFYSVSFLADAEEAGSEAAGIKPFKNLYQCINSIEEEKNILIRLLYDRDEHHRYREVQTCKKVSCEKAVSHDSEEDFRDYIRPIISDDLKYRIYVAGFASFPGTAEGNRDLGYKRIQNAIGFLENIGLQKNIPSGRFAVPEKYPFDTLYPFELLEIAEQQSAYIFFCQH